MTTLKALHILYKYIKKRPWLLKIIFFSMVVVIVLVYAIQMMITSMMGQAVGLVGGERESKGLVESLEYESILPEGMILVYREASLEFISPWALLMATHFVQSEFALERSIFRKDAVDLPDEIWNAFQISKRELEAEKREKEVEEDIEILREYLGNMDEEADTTELEDELANLEEEYYFLIHRSPILPDRDLLEDVFHTLAHYYSGMNVTKDRSIDEGIYEITKSVKNTEKIKLLWWLFGTNATSFGLAWWPMPPEYNEVFITSPFGERYDPFTGEGTFHNGIDIGATYGVPVYSVADGVVSYSGSASGFGTLVIITHDNGMESYYAHCQNLIVTSGQEVIAGEQIAEIGSEGRSTGPHLHFEIRINGEHVDPMLYLIPPGSEG